jgi:hypothetical protein
MQSTNPINVNGESYPLYAAHLAISSTYENKEFDACVSLRLIPTKLDSNGNAVLLHDHPQAIVLGKTTNADEAEKEAMSEFYNCIQKLIIAKGL